MAADLFVVPTVTFRLLFVLVILAHDRRLIVHVAVTEHSTVSQPWTRRFVMSRLEQHATGLPHRLIGLGWMFGVGAARE